MASNKPAGQSWESYVDSVFRQAREAGEFDNLPGAGKPIPGLDEHYDENWWLKQYMAREELSISPDTLKFKAELTTELDALWELPGEDQVRRKLMQLNRQIIKLNSSPVEGPPLNVGVIDIEKTVRAWRERRSRG
jgi:hypothetical protein